MFDKNEKKEGIESCTGIDIGTYAIKVFEIRKDSNQVHLESYGELEMAAYDALPPGSIANIGEEKTIAAIKDLLSAAKITSSKVVFSIPMQECFISSISIPKVSDKELSTIVPIEARKYLPVPVSEVKINYWRVDEKKENNEQDTIILAAIKNETIELYNRYANKLGFKDFSIEIESLAEAKLISKIFKQEKKYIFSIDIGGKNSFVSLIHNDIVKASSLIQKGSFDNTFQISKILNLSTDVAEEAKRVFGYIGDDSSPHLAEVMALASFPLFDEVKHLLLNYERKYNINIETIVLSGGGSLQKGIIEVLSEFLDKKVIILDVLSIFSLPENIRESLKGDEGKYAVAAGLATKIL